MSLALVPDLDTARARFWRTTTRSLVHEHPAAFARIVRRKRLALGMSERAAARACNASQTLIRSIETQQYHPGHDYIVRVMDALALTVADLRAEIAAMYDEQEADRAAA